MTNGVSERIAQLLQLCGDDPRARVAMRYDVLPVVRRLDGWIVLSRDGSLSFIDDATGPSTADLPHEWREDALRVLADRYPELTIP